MERDENVDRRQDYRYWRTFQVLLSDVFLILPSNTHYSNPAIRSYLSLQFEYNGRRGREKIEMPVV